MGTINEVTVRTLKQMTRDHHRRRKATQQLKLECHCEGSGEDNPWVTWRHLLLVFRVLVQK